MKRILPIILIISLFSCEKEPIKKEYTEFDLVGKWGVLSNTNTIGYDVVEFTQDSVTVSGESYPYTIEADNEVWYKCQEGINSCFLFKIEVVQSPDRLNCYFDFEENLNATIQKR